MLVCSGTPANTPFAISFHHFCSTLEMALIPGHLYSYGGRPKNRGDHRHYYLTTPTSFLFAD